MTSSNKKTKTPRSSPAPTSIVTERATVQDFLAIAELDRQAWLQNQQSEFIPDGEHTWRIWTEHGLVFVARSGDKILGAILAFPCHNDEYCLHKVFIDATHRGQGLGSRLFAVLLAEFDTRRITSFLTVDPVNEAAIALYVKYGFSQRTFVKGFYRESEDRFVLRRSPQNTA